MQPSALRFRIKPRPIFWERAGRGGIIESFVSPDGIFEIAAESLG